MDISSVASAFASSQASQTQTLMAAKMLKMNAQSDGAIAQVLEAAQQNIQSLANTGTGIGQNVNITA
jgi:hypothetical protein